jgi:hypothetical protein
VKVLVVTLVLLGQGLLEQSVLTPNILSYQVGMHPVLVLFSLLVFGAFLGIFGLFIAVPTMALLVTFYRAYREELTLELKNYAHHSRTPTPEVPASEPTAPTATSEAATSEAATSEAAAEDPTPSQKA